MITVNLLPESMRKKEGLPKSQALMLLLLVAVLGALVYAVTRYAFITIPALRQEERSLAQTEQALDAVVRELAELDAEIARMSGYIGAVKGLYRQRTVWAKILADVKDVVNFDPRMSEYNPEQRYLWLTGLNGRGKTLALTGFATAANEVVAMQMPERFLQGFRDYSRSVPPEEDEAAALEAELRVASGERERAIRARLEEIAAAKSGGIALRPFVDMLVPGSLQLTNASWTGAPRPRLAPQQNAGTNALFPQYAWNFNITMELK